MRKLLIGGSVAVLGLLLTAPAVVEQAFDPGPIPVCNGEQATAVLVKFGTASDYSAWEAQGVDVQEQSDNLLRGTVGHDVLVSLVSTNSGGFASDPFPGSSTNQVPVEGDFVCSFLENSDDVYYLSKGRSDWVYDAGGSDDYYLGGCLLEGDGVEGDRGCDVLYDMGAPGPNSRVSNVDGRDQIWGFTVPAGRRQRIYNADSWGHIYVGRGPGKVSVDGGRCFVGSSSAPDVPCSGIDAQVGDHVHPCPVDSSDPKILVGLESFTKVGITVTNVEYFGPESFFTDDTVNPCTYQATNR